MSATATAVDPAVQLAERVAEISSLPDTAMKIVETVQNPRSGAQDLMRVLQADPSLTARVLRTINSAAYGLSERVTDLQKAISFLGFNQIRNLALTASISGVFRDGNNVGCYNRRTLWKHMVAVAIGTRMIARRVELSNPEEGFLCGLLHDIGIILIDQYAHPQFRQVIRRLERSREGTTLVAVERDLLGFDHALLGELVARCWRFPDTICSAIQLHHSANVSKAPDPKLVQCVQAANVICSLKSLTSVGKRALECSADVFRNLGFSKLDVKVLAEDLDRGLEQQSALFELL
jgi:HD-like signal output (HDOD) protein